MYVLHRIIYLLKHTRLVFSREPPSDSQHSNVYRPEPSLRLRVTVSSIFVLPSCFLLRPLLSRITYAHTPYARYSVSEYLLSGCLVATLLSLFLHPCTHPPTLSISHPLFYLAS